MEYRAREAVVKKGLRLKKEQKLETNEKKWKRERKGMEDKNERSGK